VHHPRLWPPEELIYNSTITVTMTAETPGSIVYYTVDGSTPSEAALRYTGGIIVDSTGSTVIRAIAVKDGIRSEIISAIYIIRRRERR
jgi:hypothetical protein